MAMDEAIFNTAVEKLRGILANRINDPELSSLMEGARDASLARYQPMFLPDRARQITPEEFRSFLYFENNRHWTGLNRKGHLACGDMDKLRNALALLLDEAKPIRDRVNKVADEIPGMGRALITAILLVAFPDRYGVWNGTSEASLKALNLWPDFQRGSSFGDRYLQINEILLRLSRALGVDLWTLDALHWRVDPEAPLPVATLAVPPPGVRTQTVPDLVQEQRFGLERHLHDFMRDNWERTEIGREWVLYSEPGNEEAGYEYPTEIGRIDLLAKHRTERRWLIVELKRSQSSDDTVGQVLRYMGWVRQNLAEIDDKVEGLIVALSTDTRLRYAVSEVPSIKLMHYEVTFSLRPVAVGIVS